MIQFRHEKRLTSFWLGRKCVWCGKRAVVHTARGYVKCEKCGRSKSLKRLRRELEILLCFVEQKPALQAASQLRLSYPTVAKVYREVRELIFLQCELEGKKLSGEIEIEESYFGGKRKGTRGRGAQGKSVVLGILERNRKVYTRVVYTLSAEYLMDIIARKTRKGSVFFTDTFKSYNSLVHYGKHKTVNHSKTLVGKRNHHHINGIEGFWSYAKHKLYNYRRVSKANFALYLKEIEFRFNHRHEGILDSVINLYFGYVSL